MDNLPAVKAFSRLFNLTYDERKALRRLLKGNSIKRSVAHSLCEKGYAGIHGVQKFSGVAYGNPFLTERGLQVAEALTALGGSDTYDDSRGADKGQAGEDA